VTTSTVQPLDWRTAYASMLTIRVFEEEVLRMARAGVLGSKHLSGGQEAVPVGTLAALTEADRVVATYRGHGWALACGVPVRALLAEVAHRPEGINGGRAGSALIMAPEYGFVMENSIVGAGLPIAGGVALAARQLGTGGVAAVSFGDGALSQGGAHEALVFAKAMNLPVVFICENNEWSEMTPTSAMLPAGHLTTLAQAVDIPSVTVDGGDPFAVTRAVGEAAARARAGDGPTFIEARVVRLMAHYNADVEHYRQAEDRERDKARDPLLLARARAVGEGLATAAELDELDTRARAKMTALGEDVLALPEADTDSTAVLAPGAVPAATPARAAGETRELTYAEAVNQALADELETRPEAILYGEDIAIPGGVFGVTRRLQQRFGADRVFDTPIAESAMLGAGIGAALEGLRPVVEIMWADFLLVALDQLVNQAANFHYVTGGHRSVPLVVRTQQGATPGSCAQHSQSLEALLAHIPGLRVGLPSSPADAYSMLRAAVADPNPCILIESRALYQQKGPVTLTAGAEPLGGARLLRSGADACIVTWGTAVGRALEAAEAVAADGIEATVLDLRWLAPLDEDALLAAVTAGGGRVLIVHEANVTGGFGAEVAARIVEKRLYDLDAPVRRLGAPDTRIPAGPRLQERLLPSAEKIAAEIRALHAL
jgi:2-oxoisovalerate dehydrogenase E1 component